MKTTLALLACLAPGLIAGEMPFEANWRMVADRQTTVPPETNGFDWGQGTLMIGMMSIHKSTGEPRYADYVEQWADHHQKRQLPDLLDLPPTTGLRPGYCGHWAPATAVLLLHEARPRPERLKLAEDIAEFIREKAERGKEGGLGHWLGNHQLWVDTLYMVCPLFARLGPMQARSGLIDDAAKQILVQARHLQDEKTGLFYHMWDWDTAQRSPELWGRGNGWVIMSIADTFEALDRRNPSWKPLLEVTRKLAKGFKASQDHEGLWHTVMNDPSSYPEASATSMTVYGLLKLVRLGVIPGEYRAIALRAWETTSKRFAQDGMLTGVSAGTDPTKHANSYRKLPVGSETWGTGAYLLAGSEVRLAMKTRK